MIAYGVVLLFAGVIMLIAAAAQAGKNRSFANSSEDTLGTVIAKRRIRGKNQTRYELTVAYTADGAAYQRTVGATAAEYDTIANGEQIGLKYKPNRPKRVVRPGELHPGNVRIVLIIGLALLAVGAALFSIGRMR